MAKQDLDVINLLLAYICIYMNDYTKIGKAMIILNLLKKLILSATKTAEAINYKWLPRKQI